MLPMLRRMIAGMSVYKARLVGVRGFTGAGVFKYQRSKGGSTIYSIEAQGVAGLKCALFADEDLIADLACKDGKVAGRFNSRLGDAAIRLEKGAAIEIRQNGVAVLTGALG